MIGPRSRSFEVLGLADEVKYRFRIVAVLADDDNRHGDLSRRFRLDPEYDTDRAPRRSPTITQVTPTGISSQIRTKLRDWAVRQARAGCYCPAALSSNDSKTLYIFLPCSSAATNERE